MTEPAKDNRPKRRTMIGWLLVPLLLIGAVGTWLMLDPGFRWSRPSPDVAADLSQDAFGERVREYLLEHPEVIMEAARRFEARQQARAESEVQRVLKARAEEILRDADSPVGGTPQGDVTLVEFFDYNCPYCRRVAPVMIDAEAADPQLRIVYKEFPILGPNSTFAAKAALAVHRQGKYLAFHKALMQARGTVDEAQVLDVAAKIGVDIERMKTDMNDPAIQTAIEKNLELAQALRINGTPGFVIGEQILRGATDLKTLQGLIREARNAPN
jgi:protein-disulfide isomerase